jgi:cytochrome b561
VPGTPVRRFLLDIHKSLGMTALALLIVRLPYRLWRGAPEDTEPLSPLMRFGAGLAHWALYGLMAFMPLTGYLNSGAGGNTLPWFGLFQWPRLVPLDKSLSHIGSFLHDWGAYAVYALVGLHILAALWHRVVRKDGVMRRMWPG